MVQKSGVHQLRLVVYPIVYKVFYIPGGWEWDFWTINCSTQQETFPKGNLIFQPSMLDMLVFRVVISIKNWMGPNPNGPQSKLLQLLDTQV